MANDIYEALAKLNTTKADYTNMSANDLSELLSRPVSAARTDDELRASAENQFASLYNQKRLSAQQQYDATANSIDSQLAALADAYTAQKEQTYRDITSALGAADRAALSRGMGRSSYNLANQANIQNSGNRYLQEIYNAETNQRNALNSEKSLAAQQLAQQLASYGVDKESDILAWMDTQRENDYTKQLQELQYRNEIEKYLAEYAMDKAMLDAQLGNTSGGGTYAPKSKDDGKDDDKDDDKDDSIFDRLQNMVYSNMSNAEARTATEKELANAQEQLKSKALSESFKTLLENRRDTLKTVLNNGAPAARAYQDVKANAAVANGFLPPHTGVSSHLDPIAVYNTLNDPLGIIRKK